MNDPFIEQARHLGLDPGIQTREEFSKALKHNLDAAQTMLDENEKLRQQEAKTGEIYPQLQPETILDVHEVVHCNLFPERAGKFRSPEAEEALSGLFAELRALPFEREETQARSRQVAAQFLVRFHEIKPFEVGNEHVALVVAHHFLELEHNAQIAWPSETTQSQVLPELIENARKGDMIPLIKRIDFQVGFGVDSLNSNRSQAQHLRQPQSPEQSQHRDYTQGLSLG